MVSSSDALDISYEAPVEGRQAYTSVVHLSCENFVSEEVVSENTAVRVSEIVAVSSGDIRVGSQYAVHGVVLLLRIIQMSGMEIKSEVAEHMFQQKETEVILVLDGWGIVEDTDIGVDHLISDLKKGWDINRFFSVLSWGLGGLWKWESSIGGSADFFVGNITSGNNNNIFSVIVSTSVIHQMVKLEISNLISITFDWLSHHVLSVDIEVGILKSGLNISVMIILGLIDGCLFDKLKLSSVKIVLAEGISEKSNGGSSVSLMYLEVVVGPFSITLSAISSTHAFNGLSNLSL
jgi:hypothetical protein